MRVRIGDPRSVLVVAPHPDDETIGAYGLMARLLRRGTTVHVLIVSDGSASHPNSPAWPRGRLVRERRRETRLVLRHIGVAADRIAFLDLPDGRLQAVAGSVRRGIDRALRRLPRPALALFPSADDDHPDHRTVAAAPRRHAAIRRLTYPVWPAGQRPCGARTLPLSAQERLSKRLAIRRYRTQAGRITDDPGGFSMTPRQIAAFSRPQEVFAGR